MFFFVSPFQKQHIKAQLISVSRENKPGVITLGINYGLCRELHLDTGRDVVWIPNNTTAGSLYEQQWLPLLNNHAHMQAYSQGLG